MATWNSLSVDAFKAAMLLRRRHHRSSVSRAYYAAYAAVTGELAKAPGVTFGYSGNNPSHAKLMDYVQQIFPALGYSPQTVRELKNALRILRRIRVQADYVPQIQIDAYAAHKSLRRAEAILNSLKVPI